MQHTKQTSQKIIDEFFDLMSSDDVSEVLMNVFHLASEGSIWDKCGRQTFKKKLDIINAIINFVYELEKFKTVFQDEVLVHPGGNLSLEKNKVSISLINVTELETSINVFFKSHISKDLSFELWGNYLSAISSNSWDTNSENLKEANVAFTIHYLTELFFQMEEFNICKLS